MPSPRGSRAGKIAKLIVLCVLLVVLGSELKSATGQFGVRDFVEYWAAARLQVSGGNPYDLNQIRELERSAGDRQETPLFFLNPPWTLPFITPLGYLSFAKARFLWLLAGLAILVFCADWLWRFYDGPKDRRWLATVIVALFYPATIVSLTSGQISPIIVMGFVAFLALEQRNKLLSAGMATLLVAVKPHLSSLFWLALLMWGSLRHRRLVLRGAALALLLASSIPLISNPAIFTQYLAATKLATVYASGVGGVLVSLFGVRHIALQFVPTALGIVWFIFYWRRARPIWSWKEQLPLVLLVSVATSSYGWSTDQIVLLPAVIQAGVWLTRTRNAVLRLTAFLGYACISLTALLLRTLRMQELWFTWMPFAFLALYLAIRSALNPQEQEKPVTMSASTC